MFEVKTIGSVRCGYVFPVSDFIGTAREGKYDDLRCTDCNCKEPGFVVQCLNGQDDNVCALAGICWDCAEKHGLSMAPASDN